MSNTLSALKHRLKMIQLELIKLGKDFLRLENIPGSAEMTAWCVDLSEELTGSVGTIEVPGERGRVQIVPGHDGGAVYNAETDGILQPAIAGTPANVFYNWALLPGWQKWKPTYRYGTITAIDTSSDTCDVTLDAAVSSQQSLSINQTDTLSSVPIIYMDCNSLAFEIGDHVVIEFAGQSWGSPRVIGFYDNPRPCGTHIHFKVNGQSCQKVKVGWLFHPDYGYSTHAFSDNTGLFDTADFTIPGGNIEDYYLEVYRENFNDDNSETGTYWLNSYEKIDGKFLLPTDGNQATECASAANLRAYDYLLCGSPTTTPINFTLEDLGPTERRTVQIYNQYHGCEVRCNTLLIEGGQGREFFWDGLEWVLSMLGHFDNASFDRLSYYIRSYSPIWSVSDYFDFLVARSDVISYSMYGIGSADYMYTTPVKVYRSPTTIKNMPLLSGRLIVDAASKRIKRTIDNVVIDHSKACECVDPVYTTQNTVFVNRSLGSYPPTISSDTDSDQGGCGGAYGYLVGYSLLFHTADTATIDGLAILSDKYGRSQQFTGFTVDGSLHIRSGWIVDSGWTGGDIILCESAGGYGNDLNISGYQAKFEAVEYNGG